MLGKIWGRGRVYKPVEEMDLSDQSKETYIRADVSVPRATGLFLRIFVWTLRLWIIGPFLMRVLKAQNLIFELFANARIKEPPMYYPVYPMEEIEEPQSLRIDSSLPACQKVSQVLNCISNSSSCQPTKDEPFFRRWTIQDFWKAYRSGVVTPTEVMERFLSAVERSSKQSPGMYIFISYDCKDIRRQAAESTLRFKKGKPFSILDGVPIAVKDEIDCLPYPTTGGTKWLHMKRKVTDDATCVKRLRECGAVLVGKTNMHELGVGTSGINPNHGTTRNPYDAEKIAGGSSSGSSAAVSSGLCPAALGVDGGGSVRMPAALCGVVGFKPTYGRIPHLGVLPLNWTVGMVGVLAGTVEDALIVYSTIAGHLPTNQLASLQPCINLPLLQNSESITNLKLAKYTKWFDHCDDAIMEACYGALHRLESNYGCQILEVTLPELEEMRLAHYVTIGSECDASFGLDFEKLGVRRSSGDTELAFHVYKNFTSRELLNAQRLRFRQMYMHMEIFKRANVIVTPTTGVTAYHVQPDTHKCGELDYKNGAAMLRFQIAGNFLGLPAITVPVGYDNYGMPIGLQFVGCPWSESTLLHLANAVEGFFYQEQRKPQVFYNLLN